MRDLIGTIRSVVSQRRSFGIAYLADIAFVAGCALIATGAFLVYLPAGFVVAGALLAWVAWMAG